MMPEPNPRIDTTGGPPPEPVYISMQMQPIYIRYLSKQSIRTGIVQLVMGALCVAFNMTGLISNRYSSSVSANGIWGGTMYIITGGFGVGAGKSKTRCLIIAYMVLCILSATLTIGVLIVGILYLMVTESCLRRMEYEDSNIQQCYPYPGVTLMGLKIEFAMDILIIISGVIEGILAIYGATLGCKSGTGCCTCCDSCNSCTCCSYSCCILASSTDFQAAFPRDYMPHDEAHLISINNEGQYIRLQRPMMQGYVNPPPRFVPGNAQSRWSNPPPQHQTTGPVPPWRRFAQGSAHSRWSVPHQPRATDSAPPPLQFVPGNAHSRWPIPSHQPQATGIPGAQTEAAPIGLHTAEYTDSTQIDGDTTLLWP